MRSPIVGLKKWHNETIEEVINRCDEASADAKCMAVAIMTAGAFIADEISSGVMESPALMDLGGRITDAANAIAESMKSHA